MLTFKQLSEDAGTLKIFPLGVIKTIMSVNNNYGRNSSVTEIDTSVNKTINKAISKIVDASEQEYFIVMEVEKRFEILYRYATETKWSSITYEKENNKVYRNKDTTSKNINDIIKNLNPRVWYIGTDENRKELHKKRIEPIEDRHFVTKWDYIERTYVSSYKVDKNLIDKILDKTLAQTEFKLKSNINKYISKLISGKFRSNELKISYDNLIKTIKNYNRLYKQKSDINDIKGLKTYIKEIEQLNI